MFKRAISVLLFAAAIAAVMLVVRFQLVEPDEMGIRCSAEPLLSLACRLRGWAIQGFARHLYGPISIATALLGWIGGSIYLSLLAVTVGMAGMVLYDFDIAGVGFLLGILFLVYKPAAKAEQQQSHA